MDSDADEVSIGEDDREEFEVRDTPKKRKGEDKAVEEEAEEYEDGRIVDSRSPRRL